MILLKILLVIWVVELWTMGSFALAVWAYDIDLNIYIEEDDDELLSMRSR